MKRLILILITAALLISACGGSAPVSDAAAVDPQVSTDAVPTEPSVDMATVTEADPPSADEAQDEVSAADIGPPPVFSASLKATNPDNVFLGNGTPQVVEFFAFW